MSFYCFAMVLLCHHCLEHDVARESLIEIDQAEAWFCTDVKVNDTSHSRIV